MEKISILVPCCNVEKYVRECLDSIQAQTYTNLEIICIDDGSKDSTGTIIDEYVATDKRFKVIHKPNTGYGDSMNKGLECCTGDYIGIIESDDWIEPDMFETLLKAAKDNNLDLVRCCWYEGPTGTEREVHQDWVEKDSVYTPLDHEEVLLQQPSIWAALYRRDLLEEGHQVRFLPTPGASYQDVGFAFKTYAKSKRFMMLDRPLHHYRINSNSSVMSSGKVYCVLDEWEEIHRWICEDPALQNHFRKSSVLARMWHSGMRWNYDRLSKIALKLMFLRRTSRFFREAIADGILNVKKDANKLECKAVQRVAESPLGYHYDRLTERFQEISQHHSSSDKLQIPQKEQELISVVVPCYNTAKYIYSSLLSIVNQSYQNIEILCVDDCSTDDTKLLVHHLMRKYPQIQWLSTKKNSGLSASRNMGLSRCSGKYVLFVDGDDCLMPDAIARLYAAKQEEDDMVAGSAIVHYEDGEAHYGALVESDKNYYTIPQELQINALKEVEQACKVHVSAWGKLWKLSVIRENGIRFPEGLLYEDACFFWKYLSVAPRMHAIQEPVYLYQRHRTGSIMSDTFEKKPGMAIQHILILEDIYKYAYEKRIEHQVKNVLNKLYEPFFWFAFNHSPKSDYEAVCQTMCRILKEQEADTADSRIMEYISHYDEANKGELFMQAFGGQIPALNTEPPAIYRLNKKLRKYRKLTKVFALLSILLIILLVVMGLIAF